MKFDKCPCGSGIDFDECCSALIAGRRTAETAEQLMRSRYTAYVLKKADYLLKTTHPSVRTDDLSESIQKWMRQVEWLKLHVIASTEDRVEFVAEYMTATAPGRHHECSVFKLVAGEWFYFGEETEPE
jgi:SEC-C motif-containing protein